MSTRCHIGFYQSKDANILKPDALIYRHSDGYPHGDSGVVADIMPFLVDFHQSRGLQDTEYAAAWCLHHLIQRYVVNHQAYMEESGQSGDPRTFLGHGVCNHGFHGDIEFLYFVCPQGLDVYTARIPYTAGSQATKSSFKLVRSLALGDTWPEQS